jgi:outer membrane cobalamin receptor
VKTEIVVSANRVTTVHFELNTTVIEMDDEIVVTADYFEKDATKPVSAFRLSPREIRSSAGSAEDIFRILHSMPGVTTNGSASANLIVRGGSPDENRTLLENIEIYHPLHFARPGVSMGIISIINPSLIQSVEFMTGGFPAKYGDKLSSVFEMKLKEGNRTHFNSEYTANIGGFGLLLDGPIPGNGNLIFSVRRGFFDYVTEMMGKPVSPRYWDLVGKATYQVENNHQISFIGFYYLDEFQKDGVVKNPPHKMGKKYYYIARDVAGGALGINWRYLINKNGYFLTTLAYNNNSWNEKAGTIDDHDVDGDDLSENEFQIKSELTWQLNHAIELKGGLFGKTIDSDHLQWYAQDTTKSGFILPANTINYNPPVTYKIGGFLQTTLRPTPLLAINAGLRSEYFEFTDEQKLSPRLGLSFHLTDKMTLNAACGHYYQTPSTYVIALDPANQNLQSARSIHSIAGIDYQLNENTKMSVEIYHKDLDNTWVFADTSRARTNLGSGFARGIEFYFQKKMSENFVGSMSYTYSQSRRRDADYLPLYDFEFDQRHNLTVVAGYKFPNNWRLGVKFQYASGMPYTPVAGTANNGDYWYLVYDDPFSARYPNIHKLDIRVDRYFHFENWSLVAYLDLWNVYNRENVVYYAYQAGADGTLKEETSYDFPILPLIGLSAQF